MEPSLWNISSQLLKDYLTGVQIKFFFLQGSLYFTGEVHVFTGCWYLHVVADGCSYQLTCNIELNCNAFKHYLGVYL